MSGRKTGAVFFLFLVLLTGNLRAEIGDVVVSFSGPGTHPAGLAFDGRHLWVSDLAADRIYQLDPSSGNVLLSFASPGGDPTGLAWDGATLWCADNEKNKIYQLNPASGAVLKTLSISTSTPRGIAFKEGSLFYLDSGEDMIYRINPSSGAVLYQFEAPSGANRGLAWDGRYFWCSDRSLNEFAVIDPDYGKVVTIVPSPGGYSYGIARDGDFLWCADYESNRIFKIQVRGETVSRRMNRRNIAVSYTVLTQNKGASDMNLTTYLAVPASTPCQELLTDVAFLRQPQQMLVDNYGQQVAQYSEVLSPGQSRSYGWQVKAAVYSMRFFFLPEHTGDPAAIPAEILTTYTRDGSKYRIHDSVIQNAVAEALGSETRYYWKVRRLHDYVLSHIDYVNDHRWDSAPVCLTNGEGSCSEYTFTFIALCRAAGIPARYEAGGHIRAELPYEDTVFHRWAQVYFPDVGWVPVDCTWDDKVYPANQARYFGGYANAVFATTLGGGASNLLSWYYNVRQLSSGGSRSSSKKMDFAAFVPTAVAEKTGRPPQSFRCVNYPNPFNGETTLHVELPVRADVSLRIFDVQGRLIYTADLGSRAPGTYRFVWRGDDFWGTPVPSGIYWAQILAGRYRSVVKMSLVR